MWKHAKSIKVFERADGKARIYILARNDGLYEYRGEAEFIGNECGGIYWAPTEMSDLYVGAEEAERDAFATVPWLGQAWNVTDVIEARKAILEVARSVLSDALPPIEGARIIVRHCFIAKLDGDPDILPIIGIVSETEALPVGDERRHWQAKALTDLEPKISEAQSWAGAFGNKYLRALLARSADLFRLPA